MKKGEQKEKEKEGKKDRTSTRKDREGKEKTKKTSSKKKKDKEDKEGKRKEKSSKKQPKTKESKEEKDKAQEGGKEEDPFFGPPRIDRTEIRLIEKKGQGCFGTVWAGKCRGANVAVKIPNENRKISAAALEEFAREIELMSKIFSPNINLFMGACLEIGNIMIVTELMTGNVEQLLHSTAPLSLTCRMKMARDAAQGMAWLHGSNPTIIHRDLKSSNLLFTEKEGHYTIKVCDFGLSQLFDKGDMLRDGDQVFGSPLWMAPEVMVRDEFNEKADVYSFGIVLWELLTREPPFSHHSDLLTFRKAICGEGERPPIPRDTIKSLKNLMEISWNADPKVRPGFNQQVKELEGIIVDAAISDRLGRVFWKENFIDEDAVSNPRETVLLEHFLAIFYQFLESDPIPLPDNVSAEDLLSASPAQLKEFSSRGDTFFTRVYDAFELNGQDIGDLEIDTERLLEEVEWLCLKEVLAEEAKRNDGSEVVRMERFGEILAWFGPLDIPKGGVIGVGSFLWTLKSILETGWFFGPVSGRAAITHLKDKNPGTFLVRYSSQPGWFAISTVTSKKSIAHYRIEHEPGSKTFRLEGSKGEGYSSLIELVQAVSKSLYLLNPCENSPYHHIFIREEDAARPNLNYSVATFQ